MPEFDSDSIVLHEIDEREIYLSADEANELQSAGLSIQILPSGPTEIAERRPYRVHGNHQVGFFRLRSGRLARIETKVPVANIFSLLAVSYPFYAHRPPFLENTVPYSLTQEMPLQPLVEHFTTLVEKLLRQGLLKRYVEKEENLAAVRGSLIFQQQIRQNLVRGNRLFCRFTTSDVDNVENRIILWTLLLLQRSNRWPERLRQKLQAQVLHCAGVSIMPIRPMQTPEVIYDRLNARYREIHNWCRFFIDQMTIADKDGLVEFRGFQLNMFELFERFVFCVFQQAAERIGGVRIEKTQLPFDRKRKVGIHPDILIRGRSFLAVGDSKYKVTKDCVGRHPDLYQVVAYSTALGLIGSSHRPQALLVYPATERTPELDNDLEILTSANNESELAVRTLWLDLAAEDVFGSALRIATGVILAASTGCPRKKLSA